MRPCRDGETSGVDCEIWDHSVDPYYREDLIIGLEWQFAPNWALDVKYIDWSMQDMMFSNTQLDHKGRNTFHHRQLPRPGADRHQRGGCP